MTKRYIAGLLFLSYLAICCWLTFVSGNVSFIASSFVYFGVIYLSSLSVNRLSRLRFVQLCSSFLLVYSLYTVITHFIFIDDPFNDYFIAQDQRGYYEIAVGLASLSFSEIWSVVFTQFDYSGSPLFYAYIGMLQKITGLQGSVGLLFQNLNVAFIGSFVPGVVYLLCQRITNNKQALKAATVYGLFSFTFIYSVVLLRDIHMALIYALAFYIITGDRYNLKNYVFLVVLGIIAYYIRVENGLFFLAFLGVWLYKSGSSRKVLIASISAGGIAAVILLVGGIDTIYNMAFSTIENYRERGISRAEQGSLGVQLMTLPVPLNYIGMAAFGQISPFPFWFVFRDGILMLKNIFYVPEATAALFWFTVWMRIIIYPKKALAFYRNLKPALLITLLYILVVSMGQPGSRRLMVVYPVIFMGYLHIDNRIIKGKEVIFSAGIYAGLLVIYWFLK